MISKVLQIGKYYPPDYGGIETVTKILAEWFSKKKIHSKVLCFSKKPQNSSTKISGVEIFRAGTFLKLFSQPLSLSYLWKMIRWLPQQDLVYIHTPNLLAEVILCVYPKRQQWIMAHHCDPPHKGLLGTLYKLVHHSLLKKVDRIIISSPQLMNSIPQKSILIDKVQIIPFGIDQNLYHLNSKIEKFKKEISKNHKSYILFVGRLVPYKGIPALLKAVQSLDTHLIIIGEGPLKRNIEKQIETLGIQNKVSLLGKIENESKLIAYYHGCELFVLPSTDPCEAFGIVLLEAMACQKPIVTFSINSGVSFLQQGKKSGISVSNIGDSHSLRLAIEYLLSRPQLREEMGLNGYEKIETLFCVKNMMEQHQNTWSSS